MKKIVLALTLLIGGATATPIFIHADEAAQVCDMNRPCAYTGEAIAGGYTINIQVYYSKTDDNFVAVIDGDTKKVAYVFYDQNEGKWYVNYKSKKYYFSM